MKYSIYVVMVCLILVIGLYIIDIATAGTTRYVGTEQGDYSTIQAALNASSSGDTVIVRDGTYTGSSNRNLDFGGDDIILKSENGPDNCTIDCDDSGRGFYFHNSETNDAVVDGFTIVDGSASQGGGFSIENGASPTIKNCVVNSCSVSWYGGGLHCV